MRHSCSAAAAGDAQQPPPQRARADAERGRHRRAGRCRRPRQARPAGSRPDAVRFPGPRGRRRADDRLVHAGVLWRPGGSPPPVPAAPTGLRPARAPATAGTSPPVNSGPAVTALVFDRLTPEARRLAVQAAQAYLGTKEEAPNYIGIFGIDLALTPYAPFTRNALRAAAGADRHGGPRVRELQQPRTAAAEGRRRSAGGERRSGGGERRGGRRPRSVGRDGQRGRRRDAGADGSRR